MEDPICITLEYYGCVLLINYLLYIELLLNLRLCTH